ncbi:MAG: transglycosylase SLT domain-containing protein, partial [Bdellovibrionales bacterium]|nr:transglycosylase SLT domain-containing protein [Bdellovibrionales bacterium]
MNFFLIIPLFIATAWGQTIVPPATTVPAVSHENFVISDPLKLTRADHIVAEHLVSMIKLIEKGYVNKDILNKVILETEKKVHFKPFIPWLLAVQEISKLSKASDLIIFCRQYSLKKELFPLEKVLARTGGNYCRERTLEAISRDIDTSKVIADDATQFIQENLKFYLTKKNKKNFAFFVQSHASKPDILKKISQEVTTYSVRHEIVPSQEVLKDIVINEQITKLIQDKGFNLVQTQNVFYAEYGKLIEQGYKVIESKSNDKVKEHFTFLKNYLELNQDHLPVGLCLTRLNDFAKSVFRATFKDLSRDIYKYILKKNNKDIQEDALFFYLWTYLANNEFKDALALAEKYDLLKSSTKIMDPRIKFWLAYIHEELKDTKKALTFYEDVVFNHPLSYYSIMAVKKIQLIKPDSLAVNFYSNNSIKKAPAVSFDTKLLDQDFQSSLIRLKAWAKIDSQRLIKLEVKRLKRHSIPAFLVNLPTDKQAEARSDMHIINARIIMDSQNYLATFRYLYEVLEKKEVIFNRALLEILYPKPYLEDLNQALKKDTLDPIVVLALIRQESVFNPLARSPVGARGLMQLMPMTARRLRNSVRDKHLVNPKINIELGTKYFKGLVKRYDGNLVYVLAAYNAGEGRV